MYKVLAAVSDLPGPENDYIRGSARITNDPHISLWVLEDMELRPQLIIHSPFDELSTLTGKGVAAF